MSALLAKIFLEILFALFTVEGRATHACCYIHHALLIWNAITTHRCVHILAYISLESNADHWVGNIVAALDRA